jgi:hypothetical protein
MLNHEVISLNTEYCGFASYGKLLDEIEDKYIEYYKKHDCRDDYYPGNMECFRNDISFKCNGVVKGLEAQVEFRTLIMGW